MAQADYAPSSTGQLITAESANQSTNLPAIRVNRRHFIGRSDAHAIAGTNEAPPIRLWREKCRGVELKNLSSGYCYEATTGQGAMGPNIRALLYSTAVFFLEWLPKNILLILRRFLSRNKRLRFGVLRRRKARLAARQEIKKTTSRAAKGTQRHNKRRPLTVR